MQTVNAFWMDNDEITIKSRYEPMRFILHFKFRSVSFIAHTGHWLTAPLICPLWAFRHLHQPDLQCKQNGTRCRSILVLYTPRTLWHGTLVKPKTWPAGDNTTPMSPVISYAMQIGARTKTHTRRQPAFHPICKKQWSPISAERGMASLDRPTKCWRRSELKNGQQPGGFIQHPPWARRGRSRRNWK